MTGNKRKRRDDFPVTDFENRIFFVFFFSVLYFSRVRNAAILYAFHSIIIISCVRLYYYIFCHIEISMAVDIPPTLGRGSSAYAALAVRNKPHILAKKTLHFVNTRLSRSR